MSWFKKRDRADDESEETTVSVENSSSKSKLVVGTAAGLGTATSETYHKSSQSGFSAPGGFVAPELSLIERRYGKLRSALGPGTEVQGRLSFDSAVSLDGVLKGTIRSTELIVVSRLGRVEATSLVAKALVVEGEVTGGDITVSERLEILPGGKFIGTVSTPILVVEDGGIFDGVCNMTSKEAAAAIAIPPLSAPSAASQPSANNKQPHNSSTTTTASGTGKSSTVPSPATVSGDNKGSKKKISMDELLGK